MPVELRVLSFVDFWNYTLSMKGVDHSFQTDWKAIPKIITREAGKLVDPTALAVYSGMNVYGSYNKTTETSLNRWATTVLDTFPGVNVSFKQRTRKKSPPKCPACQSEVPKCPSCGKDMRGTEEKGVDTQIATDMISLAWESAYDVAVLVSADRDFVPVAEYLQTKGLKVIHGGFPPSGSHLQQKCWGAIDLPNFRSEFER